MMAVETDELISYLEEISKRSFEGRIPWSQPNPSTFQWVRETGDDQLVAVIQRAVAPRSRWISSTLDDVDDDSYVYLFQVQSKKSKQFVISISTNERPELRKILAKIFLGAEKGMDLMTSQFLKKLLE